MNLDNSYVDLIFYILFLKKNGFGSGKVHDQSQGHNRNISMYQIQLKIEVQRNTDS